MSDKPNKVFAIRGTYGASYVIHYVVEEQRWIIYELPSKRELQRYVSLAKAIVRVGSELEKSLKN